MTYFTATLEAPVGWTSKPAAYLAFGDTYDAERTHARRWGWPVETLQGDTCTRWSPLAVWPRPLTDFCVSNSTDPQRQSEKLCSPGQPTSPTTSFLQSAGRHETA
jgi:hypothetical protein